MITSDVVFAVRRLLLETKLSWREIARRSGVSRGSVRAIASGRRSEDATHLPAVEVDWEGPAGPPVRCPGCGGLVFMPCVFCATRKALARHVPRAMRRSTSDCMRPLGLQLRPQHFRRYQQVRARRLAADGDSPDR